MKKWLKKNKIYFETISSTLLGFMAIIVSIVSIYITLRQVKNEELLNQPRLKISSEPVAIKSDEDNSHFVVIENTGGNLTDFNSTIHTFLKIQTVINNERKVIYRRINDYFGGSIVYNNTVGIIEKYIGAGNLNLEFELEKGFDIKYGEDYPYTFISIEIFLDVGYKDFKDQEINELYKVEHVYGGIKIKRDKEVKTLLEMPLASEYIYKYSADKILEIISSGR